MKTIVSASDSAFLLIKNTIVKCAIEPWNEVMGNFLEDLFSLNKPGLG